MNKFYPKNNEVSSQEPKDLCLQKGRTHRKMLPHDALGTVSENRHTHTSPSLRNLRTWKQRSSEFLEKNMHILRKELSHTRNQKTTEEQCLQNSERKSFLTEFNGQQHN